MFYTFISVFFNIFLITFITYLIYALKDLKSAKKSELYLKSILEVLDEDITLITSDEDIYYYNHKSLSTLITPITANYRHSDDSYKVINLQELKSNLSNNDLVNLDKVICGSLGSYEFKENIDSDGNVRRFKAYHIKDINCTLIICSNITSLHNLKNTIHEMEHNCKFNCPKLKEIIKNDKCKTEFLANISHELRTPINIIFSAVQMVALKSSLSNDDFISFHRYNKMIKQNCYRLLRLIDNLIDISKIDSGFYNISIKDHEIIKIVEDITLSVANYIEDKNIELIFDTELEEKIIACDPDKIERIVLNLLTNAVKFTPEGGSIFVNIYDRGDYITLSIKDTGIGIPDDKKDIIFKRFCHAEKSSHLNASGSGIGLSLTKSLVEMHKGSIHVSSSYGHGSEFMVNLPSVLSNNSNTKSTFESSKKQNIERINIEFSDIYS
ncbi:signal transduction histidine kinase [Clostridium putrefaciens]|uniref:histidine kinase n=1 Tax=Clostridium putrefaciens TaxID=99675 RepID=A0A381JBM3_9CLOT|nr:HAMP domain-containing sensor histidine kinase [Clostridium putrefaciens]SUY48409.1 signal transduction histidine kinase [Clostridium putrefaciens]